MLRKYVSVISVKNLTDSRKTVETAGVDTRLSRVEHYPLNITEYATAFQTSNWCIFERCGLKLDIHCWRKGA